MLIVESDEPKVRRIKTAELLPEFGKLKTKCEKEMGYCLYGFSDEREYTPQDPVEVALNEKARKEIVDNNMRDKLPQYAGKRTRTARPRNERSIKLEE